MRFLARFWIFKIFVSTSNLNAHHISFNAIELYTLTKYPITSKFTMCQTKTQKKIYLKEHNIRYDNILQYFYVLTHINTLNIILFVCYDTFHVLYFYTLKIMVKNYWLETTARTMDWIIATTIKHGKNNILFLYCKNSNYFN